MELRQDKIQAERELEDLRIKFDELKKVVGDRNNERGTSR